MDEQQMKEHMEEGWDFVYIIVSVGDPQDDIYESKRMHVQEVDWNNDMVKLSYEGSTEVVDVSPFDEVFPSEESADTFIKEFM